MPITSELPEKGTFDEMMRDDGTCRPSYQRYCEWLNGVSEETVKERMKGTDLLFHRVGITFNVYGNSEGTERLIPFDPLPRIITASEWEKISRGLAQRAKALNLFLDDIYHDGKIIKQGIIPGRTVYGNSLYSPSMAGLTLPGGVYAHIIGTDLVRNSDGNYYVLEDNMRTPSGVSYMLQNRLIMMRLYPELFLTQNVRPVDLYPRMLLDTLKKSSKVEDPTVVVLTPGHYNAAFYEHAYLAQQMGVELVEGSDLFVKDSHVFMKTTAGPKQVDVIYRRIDDDFLDPLAFNPISVLGVPGLMAVYRKGNVIIANACGTGVADDKSIYPYVPEMIRYYLSEEPILNNVSTYMCRRKADLQYVLKNISDMVVKEVHGAGGYGMLVGPKSTKKQIEDFTEKLKANPANYIAQPTLSLSTCPIFDGDKISPRHIDLRPFILSSPDGCQIVPGGLTRVALKKGSLVVNSSQGGGTKDTWIVEEN